MQLHTLKCPLRDELNRCPFFQTLAVKELAQKPSYGGKNSLKCLSMKIKDPEEKSSGEALLDSYSAGEGRRCYCIAVALEVMDLYNL